MIFKYRYIKDALNPLFGAYYCIVLGRYTIYVDKFNRVKDPYIGYIYYDTKVLNTIDSLTLPTVEIFLLSELQKHYTNDL